QALLDLCFHACEATPPGGRVVVRTDRVLVSGALHPEARPGRYVRLSVRTLGQGSGVRGQGSGVSQGPLTRSSLDQVAEVARRHQGWLEWESEPGRGASVSLFLPADLGKDEQEAEGPSDSSVILHPSSFPKVVLVVDSDPHVREWSARALEAAGCF